MQNNELMEIRVYSKLANMSHPLVERDLVCERSYLLRESWAGACFSIEYRTQEVDAFVEALVALGRKWLTCEISL